MIRRRLPCFALSVAFFAASCSGPRVGADASSPTRARTPDFDPSSATTLSTGTSSTALEPSTPVGTLAGALSVSQSGTAQYRVPIEVTPGRAGMQPDLALSYDSGRGAGIAGHGWTLEGLSSIHRCATNSAHEGDAAQPVVYFDKTDPLCLDGTRLLLRSGTYGTEDAEYYPEASVSRRVVQQVDGFVVYGSDGRTSFYGGTDDTNVRGNDAVRSWALREVCDLHDNCMTYEYAFEPSGYVPWDPPIPDGADSLNHRVSAIRYTSGPSSAARRRVEFAYAPREARHNVRAWWYGAETLISEKLIRIDAYGPHDELVRSYELGHSDLEPGFEGESPRLLVNDLRECDGAGVCKPPTRFTYTMGESLSIHGGAWNGFPYDVAEGDQVTALDADADGRGDLLVRGSSNYQLYRGDGLGSGPSFMPYDTGIALEDGQRAMVADFDGNGCDDFVIQTPSRLDYYQSDCGGGFEEPTALAIAYDGEFTGSISQVALGDFDGNGRSDAMVCELEPPDGGDCEWECLEEDPEQCSPTSCPEYSAVWKNIRVGLGGPGNVSVVETDIPCAIDCTVFDGCERFSSWLAVDVTQDGATDLLQIEPFLWGSPEDVIPSSDRGYTAYSIDRYGDVSSVIKNVLQVDWFQRFNTTMWGRGADRLTDVNGDGHADVVRFHTSMESSGFMDPIPAGLCDDEEHPFDEDEDEFARALVYLNRGGRFTFPGILVLEYDEGFHQFCDEFQKSVVGDWDGDGRSDFIYPIADDDASTGTLWVAESRYPAIMDPDDVEGPHPTSVSLDDVERPIVNVNPTGTGLLGLAVWEDAAPAGLGAWELRARSGTDGLLESVTDGFGAVSTIEYTWATDPDVYTDDDCDGAPWWAVSCRPPVRPLVSRVEHETNINTIPLAETYQYEGWRFHRTRRATLGFTRRRRTDWRGGTPYASTLVEFDTSTYDAERDLFPRSGKPISTTRHTWLSQDARQHIVEETTDYVELQTDTGAILTLPRRTERVEAETTAACNLGSMDGCVPPWDAQVLGHTMTEIADFEPTYGTPRIRELSVDGVITATETMKYDTPTTDHPLVMVTSIVASGTGGIGPSQSKTTQYKYYEDGTYRLQTLTRDPGTPLELQVTYEYRDDGNLETVTRVGRDGIAGWAPARVDQLGYDPEGVFVSSETNALGHQTTYEYDRGLGVPTKIIDPNDVVTELRYDGFGRPTAQWRKAGEKGPAEDSQTTITYARIEAPEQVEEPSPLQVTSVTVGGAHVIVEHDRFGREVERRWKGHGGKDIYDQLIYDPRGWVASHSRPAEVGTLSGSSDSYDYDEMGRILEVDPPGLQPTEFSYQGNVTIITDPRNFVSEEEHDALGRPVRRTDPYGTNICFYYGGFGFLEEAHLNTTAHCGGSVPVVGDPTADAYVIDTDTNAYGWKTRVEDPNMGHRDFTYNAFGELRRIKAPLSTVTLGRDLLGRTVSRSDADGTSTWRWDTYAGAGKVGFPRTATSADGVISTYRYDDFSRLVEEKLKVGGETFTTGFAYDARGHLEHVDYPGEDGVSVFYETDDWGTTTAIRLDPYLDPIWYLGATDADGHVTREHFENGLVTERWFSHGMLDELTTVGSGGEATEYQHLQYLYDDTGNLSQRFDLIGYNKEDFSYDRVNRVSRATQSIDPAIYQTETFRYGPLGNLEYRSTLGTYVYGDPEIPSGVSQVGTSSFGYDEQGRQISRDGVTIDYAANERVRSITGPGVSANYLYDANYEQVQRTSDGVTTTRVGDRYRRSEAGFGTEATRDHFIFGPSGVVASLRFDGANPDGKLIFHHTDNLGSTDVITNADAVVMQRQSYDVFGAPRLADDWMLPGAYTNPADWDLGYTGHREEQVAGLVDMRGRMYDARIGRFIAPDPLAGLDPTTQAFERYAYVRNRPLNFVDPTGFAPELQCDEEREECWGFEQEVWRDLVIESDPGSEPGVWNEINYQLRAARGFAEDPLGDMDLPAPVEYVGIAAQTYVQMSWESSKVQMKTAAIGFGAMVAPVPAITYAAYEGLQLWDQAARAPVETALGMTPIPDAVSFLEALDAGDYRMATVAGTRMVVGIAMALALRKGLGKPGAKGSGGPGSAKTGITGPDTMKPGPYAVESIPARSKSQKFTKAEREKINEIGDKYGCHTCGTKPSGRSSGNWTPDHQPVSKTVPDGTPQVLLPHCKTCSAIQGGHVSHL